jgi:hypothetical protein
MPAQGYLKAQMIYPILFSFLFGMEREWNVQPVKTTDIIFTPDSLILTPSVSIHPKALSEGDLDGQTSYDHFEHLQGFGDGFGSFPWNHNNTNNTTLAWRGASNYRFSSSEASVAGVSQSSVRAIFQSVQDM